MLTSAGYDGTRSLSNFFCTIPDIRITSYIPALRMGPVDQFRILLIGVGQGAILEQKGGIQEKKPCLNGHFYDEIIINLSSAFFISKVKQLMPLTHLAWMVSSIAKCKKSILLPN